MYCVVGVMRIFLFAGGDESAGGAEPAAAVSEEGTDGIGCAV